MKMLAIQWEREGEKKDKRKKKFYIFFVCFILQTSALRLELYLSEIFFLSNLLHD